MIPDGLSFAEAAALPFGATTSLYFLRDRAKIGAGQSVLVVGASGALGVYGVQLSIVLGAKASGVCSTVNVDLVRSLGASSVIDYTNSDFTQSEERYDVIYDTVGATSFGRCKHVLSDSGIFVQAAFRPSTLPQMIRTSMVGKEKSYGRSCEDQEGRFDLSR